MASRETESNARRILQLDVNRGVRPFSACSKALMYCRRAILVPPFVPLLEMLRDNMVYDGKDALSRDGEVLQRVHLDILL